jgi:hypothetical protein
MYNGFDFVIVIFVWHINKKALRRNKYTIAKLCLKEKRLSKGNTS